MTHPPSEEPDQKPQTCFQAHRTRHPDEQ
jgi:hypothetical protein